MDKYYDGKFPRKKAEQNINKDLKAIVRKAKITEEIKCTYTKGGKEIIKWIPKYKLVGTHTARRSFCTNHFLKGATPNDIMHFSGHKTEREFYKYIRVTKEEKSLHIVKLGFFNLAS